jgi:hypothetical protein
MKTPEEITVEWLNERKGDYSNGQKIAIERTLKEVEAGVLEEWLLHPMSELEGGTINLLCITPKERSELPWDKFSPKKWIKELNNLESITAGIKFEKGVNNNMVNFIRKVEHWKEKKSRERNSDMS